jgi:two-component sensor histidine kinase
LSIDTAVPLGLVLNEIITNSLKYAFPGEREGEISIIAELRLNELYLKISDDGIGFTSLPEGDDKKTLGTRIIYSVVEGQLDGEITLDSSGGTSYELLLKEIKIVRRV